MSKAFTSEDATTQEPIAPLPVGRRPITAQGMQFLRQQLKALLDTTHPQAVAQGQIDADGRAKLRQLERRMQILSQTIALSDPAPAPPKNPKHVVLGTRVWLRDADHKTYAYTLVGPDETNVPARRISAQSPIGQALMGQAVGKELDIERPSGLWEVRIEKIEPA
jgi:transcription elongation GreA/GreB family factor